MTRIAIGADHAGYDLKQHLVGMLIALGHDVDDQGPAAPLQDAVELHAGLHAVASGSRPFGLLRTPAADQCGSSRCKPDVAVVKVISFPDGSPRDSALCNSDSILYVAATNGELVRIEAAGSSSKILDKTELSGGPADMAFTEAGRTAIFAQPVPDGVDVVRSGVHKFMAR